VSVPTPACAAAQRELDWLKERAGAPRRMNLGCSRVAHDRLTYCAACVPARRDGGLNGARLELEGWRLLAIIDDLSASPDSLPVTP
jgi:hypothetical protein